METAEIATLANQLAFLRNEGYSVPVYSTDLYAFFAALIGGVFTAPQSRDDQSNCVITFNYDLVLDDALRSLSIEPDYCLPPDIIEGPRQTADPRTVRLLKLHGSLNWGICVGCKDRITIAPPLLGKFSVDDWNGCERCNKSSLQTLLVPPTWDKSEYRKIMSPVWTQAVKEIRSATRICIIGYSVPDTDTFFKYLLALGLAKNDRLERFLVVDLDRNQESDDALTSSYRASVLAKYNSLLDEDFRDRKFKVLSSTDSKDSFRIRLP